MNSPTSLDSAAAPETAYFSSPPNARHDLGEDDLARDGQRQRLAEAERLALPLLVAGAHGAAEDGLDDAGLGRHLLLHAVVDAVPDARHGDEDRRLHLGEVCR